MSKSQSTYPLRLPTSVKAEVTRRAKAGAAGFQPGPVFDRMSDDWDFYACRVDNQPASIFFDLGIDSRYPASPDHR